MIRQKIPVLCVAFALSTAASTPIPKEIAACSSWIKSQVKTPSSFVLKTYGGRGRLITSEQAKRHILSDFSKMSDPANGYVCAFRASISYDVQNLYGATDRENSTCTVLVKLEQEPDVVILYGSERDAWKVFDANEQRCARPVSSGLAELP